MDGPLNRGAGAERSPEEERERCFNVLNRGKGDARLAALDRLRALDDPESRERIYLATQDAEPKVRERARILVAQIEAQEREQKLYLQLGTATYKHIAAGKSLGADGQATLERLNLAAGGADRIGKSAEPRTARIARLVELGKVVLQFYGEAKFDVPELKSDCEQVRVGLEESAAQLTAALAPPPPPEPGAILGDTLVEGQAIPIPRPRARENAGATLREIPKSGTLTHIPRSATLRESPKSGTLKEMPVNLPPGSQPLRTTLRDGFQGAQGSLAERASTFLQRYHLLVIPAAVLMSIGLFFVYKISSSRDIPRPGHGSTRPPPRRGELRAIELAEVIASKNPKEFIGRRVQWAGIADEVGEHRLLIRARAGEFSVDSEATIDSLSEGDSAVVEGTLTGVYSGKPTVKAADILGTIANPYEREQRKHQRKKRR